MGTTMLRIGPTAQYSSAQGNALGMRMELTCGLKGRDTNHNLPMIIIRIPNHLTPTTDHLSDVVAAGGAFVAPELVSTNN